MLQIRLLIVALLYLSSTICATSTEESTIDELLATTGTPSSTTIKQTEDTKEVPTVPKIYDMRVVTNIAKRIASTTITTKIKNLGESTQQAKFFVILPETAFVYAFTMDHNGNKEKHAYGWEREEARQPMKSRRKFGKIGGRVETTDSKNFTVLIDLDRQTEATFHLTYEELLVRKDQYELAFNIHPGQPVENLSFEVNLRENRRIKFFRGVPFLSSGDQNDIKNRDKFRMQALNNSARLIFNPDLDDQKAFALGGHDQLVVQYDVEIDPLKDEVLNYYYGAYVSFVHFFAPLNVPPLKKHVVFVVDSSDSLKGTKLEQVKTAMKILLDELKTGDKFNIIQLNSFNWNITAKKLKQFYPLFESKPKDIPVTDGFEVNDQNIKNAKEIVDDMYASGDPDLRSALGEALELIKEAKNKPNKSSQPIIIFLTGGQARINDESLAKFTEVNGGVAPVFSLSFGDGVYRKFLRKLSFQNQGFDRHVNENEDVSSRTKSFYKRILPTILNNDHFGYQNATKITKDMSASWFQGSELVAVGRYLTEGQPKESTQMHSLRMFTGHFIIQKLLEERTDTCNKEKYTEEVLLMAANGIYSYVTPLSTLVVNNYNDYVDPEVVAPTVPTPQTPKQDDPVDHSTREPFDDTNYPVNESTQPPPSPVWGYFEH